MSIPPAALHRLGASARPRATRAYRPVTGWVDLPQVKPLTTELARALQSEGHTMVEVRWRMRNHQFSLQRLLLGSDRTS